MKLKVAEAYTRDVGRGSIRIDYDTMDALKMSTGDFAKVTGKKSTFGKILPLYPADEGKGLVRLDGMLRKNADTPIGGKTQITKQKCTHPARLVVVEPQEAIPPIDERYLTDALEDVAVTENDYLQVPYFGSRLSFEVMMTKPKGGVRVCQQTVFKIQHLQIKKEDDKCPTCGKKL